MGDLKPFKSIMGRVLINLVNYGGITNDIDMILTTRMSNFVKIYDKYNYLVVQIVHCM